MSDLTREEEREVERVMMRLNAQAWGVSFGLIFGLGLFVATIILVIRGGENPGQHLKLLAAYFPGFSVTTLGAFIGFVYMFVIGYGFGRVIGWVYNIFAGPRR
ncbi:MAG: hypothetical protein H0W15_05055 [Gemmatimonadales bacterium]|nr:hypothetical protein [Gemmatimonadales bacterium]